MQKEQQGNRDIGDDAEYFGAPSPAGYDGSQNNGSNQADNEGIEEGREFESHGVLRLVEIALLGRADANCPYAIRRKRRSADTRVFGLAIVS